VLVVGHVYCLNKEEEALVYFLEMKRKRKRSRRRRRRMLNVIRRRSLYQV
jgi:hypothetical protein